MILDTLKFMFTHSGPYEISEKSLLNLSWVTSQPKYIINNGGWPNQTDVAGYLSYKRTGNQ